MRKEHIQEGGCGRIAKEGLKFKVGGSGWMMHGLRVKGQLIEDRHCASGFQVVDCVGAAIVALVLPPVEFPTSK